MQLGNFIDVFLDRPPPIHKLGAENHMQQLSI